MVSITQNHSKQSRSPSQVFNWNQKLRRLVETLAAIDREGHTPAGYIAEQSLSSIKQVSDFEVEEIRFDEQEIDIKKKSKTARLPKICLHLHLEVRSKRLLDCPLKGRRQRGPSTL